VETWGCAAAVDGATFVNWIAGLGGQVIQADTGKVVLDSPEAIAALSVLADVIEDGCGHCVSGLEKLEGFANGQTLFTFGTTAELDRYSERLAETELQWGVAPVPHLTEEPVVGITGSVVVMLRTTPRQQIASWLFLRFLLEPTNDAAWAMATAALPTLRSTRYLPAMEGYIEARPQYLAAVELLGNARPEPSVARWGEIRSLLESAVEAVCQGQAAPAQILAAIDSAADLLVE
jgi:multiple sugar transport system substrate-binding protein